MDEPPSYEAAMAEINATGSAPTTPSEISSINPLSSRTPPVSTVSSEISLVPIMPSEISSRSSLSSVVSLDPPVSSTIPSAPSEKLIDPSLISKVPSAPSEILIDPPLISKVPSAPSEILIDPPLISKVPSAPSEILIDPPLISKVPSAPSASSEISLDPPLISKVPSAPLLPSEVNLVPSIPSQSIQSTFGNLTDETIRRIFCDFANRNFKNGSSIVEQMNFPSIRSSYSLHYKLETFLETREAVIKNGQFKEKPLERPSNDPEPNLRSIFVLCKYKFQNSQEYVFIPNSERARVCRKCDDRGKADCLICKGAGWNPCSSCSGDGFLKDRTACITCNKSGRLICDPCYSSGRINCRICDGYKKYKSYKELKVTWTNHVDEFDVNATNIPNDLLKSATGNIILTEESTRLQPLAQFPDASVNIASLNLIFKHQKECADKVVLLQRQTIRAIPITKINYYFNGKIGEFYLYGAENIVYFENFTDLMSTEK